MASRAEACRLRSDRCARRAAVLRPGARLGWSPREVIAFAEGVAGRPWRRCGDADFRLVLAEYGALATAIAGKRARHATEADHARGD